MALGDTQLSVQDEAPCGLQIQESAWCRRDALRWNALQQSVGEPAVCEDEWVNALGLENVLQAFPSTQRNEFELAQAAQQVVPKALCLQWGQKHQSLPGRFGRKQAFPNGEGGIRLGNGILFALNLKFRGARPATRRLNANHQRAFVPLLRQPAYQSANLLR